MKKEQKEKLLKSLEELRKAVTDIDPSKIAKQMQEVKPRKKSDTAHLF